MNGLLKKIKLELFFLYKLFNPKYTPVCAGNIRCYFNYFKNRYFGSYLFKKLPNFKIEGKDDFEMHILCQKIDLWALVWTIKSFMNYSQLFPKIVIHDDGSFDSVDIGFLEAKFKNLKVIPKHEADKIIYDKIKFHNKTVAYRQKGHPLIIKLIDIFLLSRSNKVLILDSDVLFFNRPDEIIAFVRGQSNADALISGFPESFDKFQILVNNDYLKSHGLTNKKIEYMNSGIIIYNKSALTTNMLYEYFENCLRQYGDYFVEMTGWNCLIGQLNYNFLPLDRYIIKGRVSETTVTKHYTSGRRQELYAHGIDLIKKIIDI